MNFSLDVVGEINDVVVIWGWCAVRQSNDVPNLGFTTVDDVPLSVGEGLELRWVERPDVVSALDLDATAFCGGFLAVVNIASTDELQTLQVAGNEFAFANQSFHRKDSMAEFLALLPPPAVSELVGLIDIDVNALAPGASVSVALDQPESSAAENTSTTMDKAGVELAVAVLRKESYLPGQDWYFNVCVDAVYNVNDRFLCLVGWIADTAGTIDLFEVSNADYRVECRDELIHYPRTDLQEVAQKKGSNWRSMGFTLILPWVGRSLNDLKLRFGRHDDPTEQYLQMLSLKYLPGSEMAATRVVLDHVDVYHKSFNNQTAASLRAMLTEIWHKKLSREPQPSVKHYGKRAEDFAPKVSVIVPIYGRYDFVQHQVMHFSADPAMADVELIYVLDDPNIEREFNIACHGVYQTFAYPFKTVFCGENLGFAGANNLGAMQATGDFLLLLNSDVIPARPGWLADMLQRFDELDCPGILGGRLLYEDGSVQHEGMCFEEDPFYPGVWMNFHPNKGFPGDLVERFSVKEVEAVTGACMLMQRSVFEAVGGFDIGYILGDFEDSDLCMKVRAQGLKIYADGESHLYHLERQSQNLVDAGDWKFKLTMLNGMRQKAKWDEAIKSLKAAL